MYWPELSSTHIVRTYSIFQTSLFKYTFLRLCRYKKFCQKQVFRKVLLYSRSQLFRNQSRSAHVRIFDRFSEILHLTPWKFKFCSSNFHDHVSHSNSIWTREKIEEKYFVFLINDWNGRVGWSPEICIIHEYFTGEDSKSPKHVIFENRPMR